MGCEPQVEAPANLESRIAGLSESSLAVPHDSESRATMLPLASMQAGPAGTKIALIISEADSSDVRTVNVTNRKTIIKR